MQMKEQIVAAALRHESGMVFTLARPHRHNDIIHWFGKRRLSIEEFVGLCEEGFLTSDGRFVGRKEAARIAIAAGQVKQKDLCAFPSIFSEDLW